MHMSFLLSIKYTGCVPYHQKLRSAARLVNLKTMHFNLVVYLTAVSHPSVIWEYTNVYSLYK